MKKVIVSEMRNTAGTSKWVLVEKGEAIFHSFGVDYEEFETGAGNYSAAIVEWPDGRVDMVRADRIKFLVPNEAVEKASSFAHPAVNQNKYQGQSGS
ncbi:MAG: hypothetical protein Q7S46_00660 [Gallionella sp.]|nr:hypothetical protein [Gallionella sp.]